MRFHCRRDDHSVDYDMEPSTTTVEDLAVLVAAEFGIPLEDLALRHGAKRSWKVMEKADETLETMLKAFASTESSSTSLDLLVMTHEAADKLDAAAERIAQLFSASPAPALRPTSGPLLGAPAKPPLRLDDEEIQRRLYEEIQQRHIQENFESAMEFTPEAFIRVTMLYVHCEINGVQFNALVDSGAQVSIMSVAAAEKCHLLRLVDRRMKGVAMGVGQQNIMGRIHLVTAKLGDSLHVPFSFSVLEDQRMDVILGLDQLKRHRFCIDLHRNCLRFDQNNIEIPFLAEAELDEPTARLEIVDEVEKKEEGNAGAKGASRHSKKTTPHPPSLPPATASPSSSPPPKKKPSPPPPASPTRGEAFPRVVGTGDVQGEEGTAETAPDHRGRVRQRSSRPPDASGEAKKPSPPPAAKAPAQPSSLPPIEKRRVLVQQLQGVTGLENESEAAALLDLAEWDLDTAASLFFSQMD